MSAIEEARQQLAHAEKMDSEYVVPALQWVQTYAAVALVDALYRLTETLENHP